MGPSSPITRLHYLAAPLFLFWWFYTLSILDPMNVGWLKVNAGWWKDNKIPSRRFLAGQPSVSATGNGP